MASNMDLVKLDSQIVSLRTGGTLTEGEVKVRMMMMRRRRSEATARTIILTISPPRPSLTASRISASTQSRSSIKRRTSPRSPAP